MSTKLEEYLVYNTVVCLSPVHCLISSHTLSTDSFGFSTSAVIWSENMIICLSSYNPHIFLFFLSQEKVFKETKIEKFQELDKGWNLGNKGNPER